MNLRAIAVLKNSRDCVLSPSSMIRFFSLNVTFDSARVRISTAGFCPLVACAEHLLRELLDLRRASRVASVFLTLVFLAACHGSLSSWRP